MNRDEFYAQYMCEYKTDPMLEFAVEFLKTASREQVTQARREGWLTNELRKAALSIINKGYL